MRIANMPMTSVTGAMLARNVPAKGAFNNANPDKILATNKRIKRSILSYLLSGVVYVGGKGKLNPRFAKLPNGQMDYLHMHNGDDLLNPYVNYRVTSF
jgi:hypothetical protein